MHQTLHRGAFRLEQRHQEEGVVARYGLSPYFAQSIYDRDDLQVEGTDDAGEIRIIRLKSMSRSGVLQSFW
jgi:hypothetical protein